MKFKDMYYNSGNEKKWIGLLPFVEQREPNNELSIYRIYYQSLEGNNGNLSGFCAYILRTFDAFGDAFKEEDEEVNFLFGVYWKWDGCSHWEFANEFRSHDHIRDGYIHCDYPIIMQWIMNELVKLCEAHNCEH